MKRLLIFTLLFYELSLMCQDYIGHREFFYRNIQAFNKDRDIDSVIVTFIGQTTDEDLEDLQDYYLEFYGLHNSFSPLKYYFNRYGTIDSFFSQLVQPNCYIWKKRIICGETTFHDTERVVARYDSSGSPEYVLIEDGRTFRYKDIKHYTFKNIYNGNGRVVEIIKDSTYRKRIFYYRDSIVELFDNLISHEEPQLPVLDKLFRSTPGGFYNFFDWNSAFEKRISIFEQDKLIKLIEYYDYGDGLFRMETEFEYDRKGVLKREVKYKYSNGKPRLEYCIKTYKKGYLVRMELNSYGKVILEFNYQRHRDIITERFAVFDKSGEEVFNERRFKLIYKIYR